MVTIMPSNPWRCADFLERVRPGIAVSVALHAGLFFLLAYFLAFHSPMPTPAVPEDPVLTMVPPPTTPPKPQPPTHSNFHPDTTPVLHAFDPNTELTLPPELTFGRHSDETPAALAPQPPVITDPRAIYRGGLDYPVRAAELGREGYVDFDFIIEPDGTVGDPVVVAEVPENLGFAAAARKAFATWKFNPMTKDGHPIAAAAHYRITFKLN